MIDRFINNEIIIIHSCGDFLLTQQILSVGDDSTTEFLRLRLK